MKNSMIIVVMLGIFSMISMGWVSYSQERPAQPETMPLVPMMQQLLTDMQQVDRGIYTENYSLIEEGASRISDHPKMTNRDKKIVKKTLGKEVKQFVRFDMTVHHHADSMRLAAIEKNMQEVLRHYNVVQQGCVDCHANYREQISKARN